MATLQNNHHHQSATKIGGGDPLNVSMNQSALTLTTQITDNRGGGGAGAGGSGGMNDPINLALNKNDDGDSHGLAGPLVQNRRNSGEESDARACRICLDEEEDVLSGNPFITPCKCMGSMKYIHL